MTLAVVRKHGADIARFVLRPGSRLVRCEYIAVQGMDRNYRTLGRGLHVFAGAFGAGVEIVLYGAGVDEVPEYLRPLARVAR